MPPSVTGGVLVIPKGLLYQLMRVTPSPTFGTRDRHSIEFAAMNAVMQIEKEQGYQPSDVSAIKCRLRCGIQDSRSNAQRWLCAALY